MPFALPKSIRFPWNKILFLLKLFLILILVLSLISLSVLLFLFSKPVEKVFSDYQNSVNGSYNLAKSKVLEIQSKEDSSINEVCRSKVLDHGEKVKKVIVLFHGFTNCPAQYSQLVESFYQKGFNVYIPRIPHHGLKDRLTTDPENLTSLELTNLASESADIASGLGTEITFFGISGGAVVAAWGGYHLSEVKQVFLSAPLFTPTAYSTWQLNFMSNTLDLLPSFFKWWDDNYKEKIEGPVYGYPQYSLKAVRAFLNLTIDLRQSLVKDLSDQRGKKLVLLTVENDPAISNISAYSILQTWASKPGVGLTTYQFPTETGLNHDFIDPNQRQAHTNIVYPKVLELVGVGERVSE